MDQAPPTIAQRVGSIQGAGFLLWLLLCGCWSSQHSHLHIILVFLGLKEMLVHPWTLILTISTQVHGPFVHGSFPLLSSLVD